MNKETINYFLDKGILVSSEIIDLINKGHSKEEVISILNKEENLIVVDKNSFSPEKKLETDFNKVKIIKSFELDPQKREINDFVKHFKTRYNSLKNILMNHLELQNTLSIDKGNRKMDSQVSFIGMVNDKRMTKNGNLFVNIEDFTGNINVIFLQDKEYFNSAKDIVLDGVIGVKGTISNNFLIVNNLFFPEIPINNELKQIDEEVYSAFISDIHIGSSDFLEKKFDKFINWLNGDQGTLEEKEFVKKIKYLFIVGDLVDGVDIYPDHFLDLNIKNIKEQYELLAYHLRKIRKDISLIICPGNHDAVMLNEPQPFISKEIAPSLYELENAYLVSNPSVVNINSSENFEGFNVLLYHGASMHYFISNVDSLRELNARDNPGVVGKFLLKKRHLAPTQKSTVYVPCGDIDPLLIEKVPDFFVMGEMHRSDIVTYKNTTIINCSCWQSKTSYQEKTGNNPDPGKVIVASLKNRKTYVFDF
tara:strand:+ start:73953 stop:75383 length:1431 start_codon:yes stop_codon:yes gene_type:complete